jgi:tRNA pseudouridine55 synthase
MPEKNCIYLIDKPLHWTSFDVVAKLRTPLKKIFGKNYKIGHAGTLDPLATGLLIVCAGDKTKEAENYQAQTKIYTGSISLGKTTPSYDLETEFNSEKPFSHIKEEEIRATAEKLTGEIEQTPPIFSAVKIDGKAAYISARKGKDVVIKARKINIYRFVIEKIELPEVYFTIECSKGTYIRTIANDFGDILGCGAHLSSLRRTHIGEFSVENALTPAVWLENLTKEPTLTVISEDTNKGEETQKPFSPKIQIEI